MNNHLNIYTDASHDSQTKVGGYAFWCEGDRIHYGWGTVTDLKSPEQAELYAIYMATCASIVENHSGLLLFHSDCFGLVKRMNKGRCRKKWESKIYNNIKRTGVQWIFNWVPRNSTVQMAWCDSIANSQRLNYE